MSHRNTLTVRPPSMNTWGNDNESHNNIGPSTSQSSVTSPSTNLQPLQNQPGTAVAQRLRDQIDYVPGKATKIGRNLPRFASKFWKDVKPELKRHAVKYEMGQFARGAHATKAFQKQLHRELQTKLDSLPNAGGFVRALAQAYINRKYGVDRYALRFKSGEHGAQFNAKGTSLKGAIIRSENGLLFELPDKIGPQDRQALLDEKGLRLTDKAPVLGEGGSATVRIAKLLTDEGSEFVAAKQYKKNKRADPGTEHALLRRLPNGEYFPQLRERALVPADEAYLFMELAGYGDAAAVMRRFPKIADENTREKVKRTFAKECILAVKALKEQTNPRVDHRDIKTDNFLVTNEPRVFLSDYGYATTDNKFGVQPDGSEISMGTPSFLDPRFRKTGATAEDADKYSLGATLYELATGKYESEYKTEGWEGYDSAAEEGKTLESVAKKLMDKDPANRPDFDELLNLPYFREETFFKDELGEYIKPRSR